MRFLQYVSQKSLLRQYCNAKVQKLFQLPPFAVLNLPKVDEETVCHDGFYHIAFMVFSLLVKMACKKEEEI